MKLLRNRWARRLLIAAASLLVLGTLAATVTWYVVRNKGIARRDALVAELDATDPDWRIDRLTSARNAGLPPDDRNAAVIATRSHEKLSKAYYDWNQKSETGQWMYELELPHLPHAEDVADFREHLNPEMEAVTLACGIRHIPSGGLAYSYDEPVIDGPYKLEPQQRLRRTFHLLSQVALVSAYDRNGNDAVESCHAILAVARGIGDDPTLVTQLIRIAGVATSVRSTERTLAWCDTFDNAKLADLQAAFAAEAEAPRLWYALRGARAIFYQVCEEIDRGEVGDPGHGNQLVVYRTPLLNVPRRATIPDQQAIGLGMYNRLIAAVKAPPSPTRTEAVTHLTIECEQLTGLKMRTDEVLVCGPDLTGPHPLLRVLLPSVYKYNEADTRTAATLQTARVALACERHRLKTGAFPVALADLPKSLLAEVPIDPYTGRPMLYKKTEDGAVVYVTGADRNDDGGKLYPTSKVDFDIGFRLFDPAHRRKPPRPKPDPDRDD